MNRIVSSPAERLIFALDVPSPQEAIKCIDDLDGVVTFFKVGLELSLSVDSGFFRQIKDRSCRIFLDLKMNDVDETIRRAVNAAALQGIDFLTIQGNGVTARSAAKGKGDLPIQLLFVPILSSLDEEELRDLRLIGPTSTGPSRFETLDDFVLWRADQALTNGCDGLIASGPYVGKLRKQFSNALIVSPGIRPPGSSTDEHKRFLTPGEAIQAGADYLVVGRPIRYASNRKEAAQKIIEDMTTAEQNCLER